MPTTPQEYRDRALAKTLRRMRGGKTCAYEHVHVSSLSGGSVVGRQLSVWRLYKLPSVDRARALDERVTDVLWLGDCTVMVKMPDHGLRFESGDELRAYEMVHGYIQPFFFPELHHRRKARGENIRDDVMAFKAELAAR